MLFRSAAALAASTTSACALPFFLPRMGPWERDGVPLSPFLRAHGEQAGTIRYLENANG